MYKRVSELKGLRSRKMIRLNVDFSTWVDLRLNANGCSYWPKRGLLVYRVEVYMRMEIINQDVWL